ncbi:putative epidermal cell surface receptor isoform X2 [Pomacea canaliculata]|uniref:putative epidermal cell surface receptor isoform X2 n=1 Tax=Pomacea canaliculata TaxID=400727 RepID=UPI000D739AA3|nr:putative epidermal cell surface receptor isoform X2 [Pomacea canaliculata]
MPTGPIPTGGIGYCVYKNKMYRQSERWVDGCDYNCICEDASTGFWRCADMCLKYPPMNQYCQLIADPDSPCCKKPFCQIPGVLGGLVGLGSTPIPVVTTMPSVSFTPTESPKPATCVYKGTQYAQGQQWFDGCDSKCVCYDASSNLYTCSQRCSTYYGIDTSRCTMKPDPSDPACCTIPVCTPITATPPTGPTPVPSVPGGSFVVTNVPGIGYCDYKGTRYSQGQVWQDGCDYKCDCVDASEGQYQCNEM